MINVHARLTEAFATLPEIMEMKPNYKWGDEMHLNQLMKLYNNDQKNPYPLIYNVNNTSDQDAKKRIADCRLSLVLAYRNIHTDHLNPTRWATSYNTMLFPLAQYIEQCFAKAGIFVWDKTYRLLEFPNFGNVQENETTDIWDALRFDTTITINNNCLNKILYDTN